MLAQPYEYRATVTKVVDGDTIDADVDLGFRIHSQMRFRLFGINAPEMHGDSKVAGVASREALAGLVLLRPTLIKTHKDSQEKYGRYLCVIIVQDEDGVRVNVNERMVREGYAVDAHY